MAPELHLIFKLKNYLLNLESVYVYAVMVVVTHVHAGCLQTPNEGTGPLELEADVS